jgi:mono/diheme cytochrome c family protein
MPAAGVAAFGVLALGPVPLVQGAVALAAAEVQTFTDRHCSSCHNDVDKEAGLDLTSLDYAPDDPANFMTWVKVHDRVQAGEMPPKEKRRPEPQQIASFVKGIATSLTSFEREVVAREGRATRRRLNRAEYENALRDLLSAPWLEVKAQLPEDGEAFRFDKVSTALDVSYVHMTRYMSAAEYAMRQAMSMQADRPPTTLQRHYARDQDRWTRVFTPRVGNGGPDRLKFPALGNLAQPDVRSRKAPLSVGDADPVIREQEAVGGTSSNYPPGSVDLGWHSFNAPVAGRYRFRFSGYTLWVGGGGHNTRFANGRDQVGKPGFSEWFRPNYDLISEGRRPEIITLYAKGAGDRKIGGFDVFPEPSISGWTEAWLMANEYVVTDPSRFFRSRPTGYQGGFTNKLVQKDGMPAVAFRWMEVEGPIYDESTAAGYRLLFADLPLKKIEPPMPAVPDGNARGRGGRGVRRPPAAYEVLSTNPEADAERLMRQFLPRAYRRSVNERDVQRFLGLVRDRMAAGLKFTEAMLAGYTAVLSSPEFIFVDDQPGRLDDHALATRLALFLWNSEPDEALRARAAKGELRRPEVLEAEMERMLADPSTNRFVAAFLDYWLEIRKMTDTTPSTTLYSDYYLDDSLTEAMVEESRLYFSDLLSRNLPARNVVDSNFTYLNERLAAHYGIPGVEGIAMRRVSIPADSPRGGLMTQASILKVTANGTTTSPVIRGKWIMERIVGHELPPPPAAVPAVEPDIRGAVTIRQQLDKHRADESCAVCHRKIDPPGFALESFDVMGAWRERYRGTAIDQEPERGFGHNGWPFAHYLAMPVDPSGQLVDGRQFRDVRDFKQLLLADEEQIARNLARQLSVYATGSPVRFSDREAIEAILEKTKAGDYGVRNLVQEIIRSDLFLNK